jgi:hypothetical protein
MKTLNNFILAVSAAAMLGTTGLYAQPAVVADVPFSFTADGAKMPAGQYRLTAINRTSGVIQMLNLDTHKSILVFAPDLVSTYKGKGEESGVIIFHRYGDRYFFSEVWTSDGLRGRAWPSKLEKEIQSGGERLALVSIPLAGAAQ